MSLTTLDEAKARQIDPGAPSPQKRLEAMAKLNAAGIKTRLFIMPILPGITDNPVELETLVKAAAETGVHSIAADTLRIARGLEDYFDDFLDKYYPELHPRYERLYAGGRRTLVVDAYRDALKKKVNEWRIQYGMTETRHTPEETRAELAQQASLSHYLAEAAQIATGNLTQNKSAESNPRAKTNRKTLYLSAKLPEQTAFEFGE
jgi:DNA repair photolyase